MALALTVPLSKGESATSFASRLAARNGSQYVQDFAEDMALSWHAIVAGDADALAELAALGGVARATLERHAILPGDGHRRRRIGDEIVHHKTLRHIRQHVCPLCVRGAEASAGGAPVTWQLEPMRRCPIHAVALVELPRAEFPRAVHDLAGRVRDHRALIEDAARDPEAVEVSAFDRYMAERVLHGRSGASWLDGSDLACTWRVCETVGIVLMHGPSIRVDRLRSADLAAATGAGFDAIGGAKADLAGTLRAIHARSGNRSGNERGGGFYSEFEPLARFLGKLHEGAGLGRGAGGHPGLRRGDLSRRAGGRRPRPPLPSSAGALADDRGTGLQHPPSPPAASRPGRRRDPGSCRAARPGAAPVVRRGRVGPVPPPLRAVTQLEGRGGGDRGAARTPRAGRRAGRPGAYRGDS